MDDKNEVPPIAPDYKLIEKQPRDWTGIILCGAIFVAAFVIGMMTNGR